MYLNHRATLQCTHGGRVMLIPPPMRSMSVMHSPIVTEPDLLQAVIVGCAQMGPGVKPCTKIVQIVVGRSFQIQVDNQVPILETLVALTDGGPPGMVQAIDNGQSNATPGFLTAQALTNAIAARQGRAFCDT